MTLRLARLVALLCGAAGIWACTCPGPTEEIFLLHMPDAETQQLVDQCLQARTCTPLCARLVGQSRSGEIVHCEIHAQTDPELIQVHVGLTSFCPGD